MQAIIINLVLTNALLYLILYNIVKIRRFVESDPRRIPHYLADMKDAINALGEYDNGNPNEEKEEGK